MTIDTSQRNREIGLYALAFGLALVLRLVRLGELPLGDAEARWALQALNLAKGLRPAIGPQPAYVVLTTLAFFILQFSSFTARLVPALFGSLLSLVPSQFRDRLGAKPALILAFFVAFDPGLLAISRQAGSPIMALTTVLFAWGAWRNGNTRMAGIWVGLALLSGPAAWPGLLSLLVGWGLLRGLFNRPAPTDGGAEEEPALRTTVDRGAWITLASSAALTYLILGSFFLLAAGGLGAGLASIPAYFNGWFGYSGVPAMRLVAGLFFYELLFFILAVASIVRGILNRDELVIGLGLWTLAALVLVLSNPSRQAGDLAWVLVPLLALAAVEVSGYLIPIQDGTWETLGMAAFTIALLVFAWLNYSAIALVPMEQQAGQLRWWILFGSLGLLVVSIIMVAFGWSILTAVQGGLWGSLLVLVVYTLSMSIASGGLRTTRTYEIWPSSPYIGQEKTLLNQLNELSRWKQGVNSDLDVAVAGVDSPALLWALRDWPVTVMPDANPAGAAPSVVITLDQAANSGLQTTYRGQDLSWRVYPVWDQGMPADWLRWSIVHDFPASSEKIILWVRGDIFVDSQNNR